MGWWLGWNAWESNINVSGNSSTVNVSLAVGWDYGSWAGDTPSCYIEINGQQRYNTGTNFNTGRSSSGSQTLATASLSVPHNTDGSKTVSYSGYYDGTGSGRKSFSGTITLTKIGRASSFTCSNSGTIGEDTISISINKKVSTYNDKVYLYFGGTTYTISSGTTSTSLTYALPISLLEKIPSSTSGIGTISVETYNGSTYIGSAGSKNITLNCPNYFYSPTISVTPVHDYSIVSSDRFDPTYYVQNLTKVQTSISNASAYQGASISINTSIAGTNYSGSSFVSNALPLSGSVRITTTVTDSRGKTGSTYTDISVYPYQPPSFTVKAALSGTTNTIKIAGSISSVNNTNEKVCTSITWVASDSTTGTLTIPTLSDYSFNTSLAHTDVNTALTYTYEVTIRDKVYSITQNGSNGIVCMSHHVGGDGVTFGGEATSSGLVSKWPLTIRDSITYKNSNDTILGIGLHTGNLLDYVYPIGSIYMSINNASPASFLGGTWEQITDRFLLSASDIDVETPTYEAGDIGGSATHTLTINEMPSHNHGVLHLGSFSGSTQGWVGQSGTRDGASTDPRGGGQPHNNMPPYLVVYMWKRTA